MTRVRCLEDRAGAAHGIDDAMRYLFIAAPGSVTPFPIDRYSTSIIFNTAQPRRLIRALAFNHPKRPLMQRVGLQPRRVAIDGGGLPFKAMAWRAGARLRRRAPSSA